MIMPLEFARFFASFYRSVRLRLLWREESWQKTGNGLYMRIKRDNLRDRALLFGYYEADLVYWIKYMIPFSSTVIDIGANQGYFTLLLAKIVGSDGHVVAVEPDPQAAEMLQANIVRNKFDNITIQPFVLGDRMEKVQFFVSHQSSFSTRFPNDIAKSFVSHVISVEMKTLDYLLEELNILSSSNLSFVKIDAEGSEPFILTGMYHTLSRFHPVIWFEVNRTALQVANIHSDSIETLLRDAGYSLFKPIWQRDRLLLRGFLSLIRLDSFDLEDSCFNVVAFVETPEFLDKIEQAHIIVK